MSKKKNPPLSEIQQQEQASSVSSSSTNVKTNGSFESTTTESTLVPGSSTSTITTVVPSEIKDKTLPGRKSSIKSLPVIHKDAAESNRSELKDNSSEIAASGIRNTSELGNLAAVASPEKTS